MQILQGCYILCAPYLSVTISLNSSRSSESNFYYRENSVTIRAALALVVYQPPKTSKLINSAIDQHTEKEPIFQYTCKHVVCILL